jgi:CspA family cold shock protein
VATATTTIDGKACLLCGLRGLCVQRRRQVVGHASGPAEHHPGSAGDEGQKVISYFSRARVSGLEAIMTGTIRTLRVDKGFGFIKDDGGKEYFFHQSAVYGEGLDNLREGDSVEFDVGEGPKGPRAENVRRTST